MTASTKIRLVKYAPSSVRHGLSITMPKHRHADALPCTSEILP